MAKVSFIEAAAVRIVPPDPTGPSALGNDPDQT